MTLTSWSGEARPNNEPDMNAIFSGTDGDRHGRILVVGEAFGKKEMETRVAFSGSSGKLLKELLIAAGVHISDCLFTGMIHAQAVGGDMAHFLLPNERGASTVKELRPNVLLIEALRKLDAIIHYMQPELIVACGNWPLWWLTEVATTRTVKGCRVPEGIGNWAGSKLWLVPSPFGRAEHNIPVLPIFHPSSILRQNPWRVITAADLQRIPGILENPNKVPEEIIHVRPSVEVIRDFLTTYGMEEITCDLETFKKRIHIVGLGINNIALSIPFFHILSDGATHPVYSSEEFAQIFTLLYEFFLAPTTRLVGQNFSYDIQYIAKFFCSLPKVTFDTMIAQHILFPALRGFKGLDSLSRFYCEYNVYWKDERKISLQSEDLDQACRYNARDVLVTSEVAAAERKALISTAKMHLLEERMEFFEAVRDMMLHGVRTNETLRKAQRAEILSQMLIIGQWLEDVIPDRLKNKSAVTPWYRSPQQTCYLFYRQLKFQGGWNKQTEGYSVDKETLAALSKKYPSFAGLFSALILYKSLSTIYSGYYAAPLGDDNRLRCSYNLAGPITNRLASSEDAWGSGTNLQNILRERESMDMLNQTLV
jgi:uracil-DNA glycosylase family 4